MFVLSHDQLTTHNPDDIQLQLDTLYQVHQALYPRIRSSRWALHAHPNKSARVSERSATNLYENPIATAAYYRSSDQAKLVERLMGMDDSRGTETYRHPVIEVRLSDDHLAVELVVSPMAWWDQQNLIGKLALEPCRYEFLALLRNLDDEMRFGFWRGAHLSDMNVMAWHLLRGSIFDEWVSTFLDGRDYWRVGMWYGLDDNWDTRRVVDETHRQISALYSLYEFIAWSGDNNYRTFYQKLVDGRL